MNYLCSYKPIIFTAQGRMAVSVYGFAPFIGNSCRREPDFESAYPSISTVCRGSKFTPRLHVGDKVVYITVKGRYLDYKKRHWRFVSVLEVIKRFNNHAEAAKWYQSLDVTLPSNCMIPGNNPIPFEKTSGSLPKELRAKKRNISNDRLIQLWDARYKKRTNVCGVFLACKAIYLELYNPTILTNDMLEYIFGRIPGTRNPPKITEYEFTRFQQLTLY